MEYNFREIEQRWQQYWKQNEVYKVSNESAKPKCYVLDMFPYPSGAGLHVGHPLGYIASDIYSRYKRLKGFNVLHPMGFDSFGLPAEQYALETGQHPAVTTEKNIATFKSQLDKIGFCYDWSREVRTSDPAYYKWTQWIFLQLFESYFCNTQKKARPIADLVKKYETQGNKNFTAEEWNAYSEKQQQDILMQRRLAFSAYGEVNWCEALGTVLANDEVVNGVSERGGHPVIKKKMRQWYLRITAYADRLLEGLETVNFSDAMKEMQRNWIGKSSGAEMEFGIGSRNIGMELGVKVYTTRPDTIFGVDFLVLAPEHALVNAITSEEQKYAIQEYLTYVKSRSDRERQSEVKQITGCFTGAFALNPFNNKQIPIWIAEYVLAGYGTGAIMAVPCGDQRDFLFAKHFNIPITNIIGEHYNGNEANPTKDAILENSGFLDGMLMRDAIEVAMNKIEELGIGKRKVNYKMRDAGFSRQRYWGEPFPIVWKDGVAIPLDEKELPLELTYVETYGPGPEGEGPLANIPSWTEKNLETSTMPGYAGSSWYFLRYMDPGNNTTFCDRNASDYWQQVDVYVGGTEHAVGHLLYSRMWTKFLFDRGLISFDEPFKKLVNQGMITGVSEKLIRGATGDIDEPSESGKPNSITSSSNRIYIPWVKDKYSYHIDDSEDYFIIQYSSDLKDSVPFGHLEINVPINFVNDGVLDVVSYSDLLKEQGNDYQVYVCKEGYYNSKTKTWFNFNREEIKPLEFRTIQVVEKMSKSKRNVVNPNDIVYKYGADTFRMYEMFLGPVEQSKPWDTKGIEGVHRFLKKLWRLFYDDVKGAIWTSTAPSPLERAGGEASDAEWKVLHKTIKKIEQDTENFSFNTAVSAFMVCVNELTDLKCHKKEMLEKLLVLLVPYAPHITEELWKALGNEGTVLDAAYPILEEKYLVESSKEYPISINGKLRTTINISLDADQKQVETFVLENEIVQKWLEGKPPKKIIFVKNKMVNVVI